MAPVELRTLPVTLDPARRIPQLLGGLVLYGASLAMQIRGGLGPNPWTCSTRASPRRRR